MAKILAVRMDAALPAKAEAKASLLGLDRAKYLRSLIEDDLAGMNKPTRLRISPSGRSMQRLRQGGDQSGNPRENAPDNMKEIADAGPIVARRFRNDPVAVPKRLAQVV